MSRLAAEGGVIVASVLVALAVDAWWDGYQQRRSVERYVASIVEELDAISARIDRSDRLASIAEEAARSWLSDAENVTVDSLNALLGGMVMWATADLTVPSITTLLNSGQISLIEDHELRNWLEAFPTEVLDFEEEEASQSGCSGSVSSWKVW